MFQHGTDFRKIDPALVWGLCMLCGLFFYLSSRKKP
jgi:hypothetical protein